jgi:hypothetical protein
VDFLGKYLAVIGNKMNNPALILSNDGGSIQQNMVKIIENRLNRIVSSNFDTSLKINIPNGSCSIDQSFLENNIDFFLLYIGIAVSPYYRCIDCDRLIKHLNDCCKCFDVYGNTMREYFIEKEKLLRKKIC